MLLLIYYRFIQIFRVLFPYFASGLLIGTFLSIFLTKQIASGVKRFEHIKPAWLAYVVAAAIGVASPICMFGTLPILMSLKKQGIKEAILVSFMTGSVLLNPNLIILTMALGSDVAMWRVGIAIVTGTVAGGLARMYQKRRHIPIYKDVQFDYHSKSAMIDNPILRYLYGLHRTILKTVPYFFVGILLTVLIETYVPLSVLTNVLNVNSSISVLLATMLGVPLYACGGGTIPILRVLMASGLGLGSALAFMVSGPMTKINNISAVKMVLGAKHFVYYIVYAIGISLVIGIMVNFSLVVFNS